jgi:hypothetical protein
MLSRPNRHISGAIGCDKPDAGATRIALALRAVLAKDHITHRRHLVPGVRALAFPFASEVKIKTVTEHPRTQQKR